MRKELVVLVPDFRRARRPEQRYAGLPTLDIACHGTPAEWNQPTGMYWGKHAKKFFQNKSWGHLVESPATPNIDALLCFLHERNILHKLCAPVAHDDGWWRMHWAGLRLTDVVQDGWLRAWHGTKIESIWSIVHHGCLLSSGVNVMRERTKQSLVGVYAHNDATHKKAENYMRFVPLCKDGVFWAVKIELMVEAGRVRSPKKSDQWVVPQTAVKIAALWFCGRTAAELDAKSNGAPVARGWEPIDEGNPLCDDAVWTRCNGRLEIVQPPPPPRLGDDPATLYMGD